VGRDMVEIDRLRWGGDPLVLTTNSQSIISI
jgi:hypothetical protein